MPVINCNIWISVTDSTDEGSDESKGLSDGSDDFNKSISGNFVRFSIGYLSKKLLSLWQKGKEILKASPFFLCFFNSAYKLKWAQK